MEVLLTVAAYLFVIGCVLFLPFVLFVVVVVLAENRKRLALVLAGVLLGAELLCGAILYVRPLYSCPDVYAMYIEESRETWLKRGDLPARRGFWSARIPCLAVCNRVIYAAEDTVHVQTLYFPVGSCVTGVNSDGLYSVD